MKKNSFFKSLTIIFIFLTCTNLTLGQVNQSCKKLLTKYKFAIVSIEVELYNFVTHENNISKGTGFIVSEEGHVIIADHVISKENHKIRSIKAERGNNVNHIEELELVKRLDWDIAILQFRDKSKIYSTVPLGTHRKIKKTEEFCSLSFSMFQSLGLDLSSGSFKGKDSQRWITDMQSFSGESGAPVFSPVTNRVIAMKYGEYVEANGRLNLLTPLHLGKSSIEDITGAEMSKHEILFIESIDVSFATGDNSKEANTNVLTWVERDGQKIGEIPNDFGFNEKWKKDHSTTANIDLKNNRIPVNRCGNLKLFVSKTGVHQWDVRFRASAKLSNGKTLLMLSADREFYKHGDKDNFLPIVRKLSCNSQTVDILIKESKKLSRRFLGIPLTLPNL